MVEVRCVLSFMVVLVFTGGVGGKVLGWWFKVNDVYERCDGRAGAGNGGGCTNIAVF